MRSFPMVKKKRNIELTQVTQWEDGKATRVEDFLAAEEPLEMRAGRYSLGVTLRTPGDDEELVAGFLFTEGVISRREDLVGLRRVRKGVHHATPAARSAPSRGRFAFRSRDALRVAANFARHAGCLWPN